MRGIYFCSRKYNRDTFGVEYAILKDDFVTAYPQFIGFSVGWFALWKRRKMSVSSPCTGHFSEELSIYVIHSDSCTCLLSVSHDILAFVEWIFMELPELSDNYVYFHFTLC